MTRLKKVTEGKKVCPDEDQSQVTEWTFEKGNREWR